VRRLAFLPVLLALALALPGAAVAAEPTTTNYEQKAKPPTQPSTGTSPSKESSKPTPASKATAPSTTSTTPTTAKESKASTLPFTGFDLRWSLGIGLLLIGAGFSIVVVQRRQARRDQS
jgi:hypothetical protein